MKLVFDTTPMVRPVRRPSVDSDGRRTITCTRIAELILHVETLDAFGNDYTIDAARTPSGRRVWTVTTEPITAVRDAIEGAER